VGSHMPFLPTFAHAPLHTSNFPIPLYFFLLLILDTIRFFSIFFRKWANFVAGLRAVCRPFPAITVAPSR